MSERPSAYVKLHSNRNPRPVHDVILRLALCTGFQAYRTYRGHTQAGPLLRGNLSPSSMQDLSIFVNRGLLHHQRTVGSDCKGAKVSTAMQLICTPYYVRISVQMGPNGPVSRGQIRGYLRSAIRGISTHCINDYRCLRVDLCSLLVVRRQ